MQTPISFISHILSLKPDTPIKPSGVAITITMRDRSKNRKPLQRGRNLSSEAIQTVQSLKRATKMDGCDETRSLDKVFETKFRRLLKLDMMAVLKELLRQEHCNLAFKVFEDIRKEYWYKPRVALYAEMISVNASNGLFETVNILHSYLKTEANLQPELEGFNALFKTLLEFNITDLVIESYDLMKTIGCEPDRITFRLLINGLESVGEKQFSSLVRQDAREIYGSLEFLLEEEEMVDF